MAEFSQAERHHSGRGLTDDIVTRLRYVVYDDVNAMLIEAADEIERLRAAGDTLAAQITKPCRCVEAHDGAVNQTCAPCASCFDWEQARRAA